MKRKLLAIVGLSVVVMCAFTGCGSRTTKEVQTTEVIEETETVLEAEVTEEIGETVVETEMPEETETKEASAFTVTDMTAVKYAKQTVNVRKAPGYRL